MLEDASPGFRRSSFCGSAACIEVAFPTADRVVVRDGKRPSAGQQIFSGSAWNAFTSAIRAGEFDR